MGVSRIYEHFTKIQQYDTDHVEKSLIVYRTPVASSSSQLLTLVAAGYEPYEKRYRLAMQGALVVSHKFKGVSCRAFLELPFMRGVS